MNFKDILQEHNIRIAPPGHDHYRPGWINIDCPWCSRDSHKFYMGYNVQSAYVNCWYCGHHPLNKTLAELLGISLKQTVALTKGLDKGKRPERVPHRGKLVLPPGLCDLTKPFRKYLKGRDFLPGEIERLWKIQGLNLRALRLKFRIFIPIHLHGEVVSWTTRSIGNSKKGRYISASPDKEAVDHKTLLYGEDYCRHVCLVLEGPLDTWRFGPGSIATFGTVVSPGQIARIAKYPVRAVCFDNEFKAQQQADKLVDDLSVFPGQTYKINLDSSDPGEATAKEIRKVKRFLNL